MEDIENQAIPTAEQQSSELPRERELFNPALTLGYSALESNGRRALSSYTLHHNSISPSQHAELEHTITVSSWETLVEIEKARKVMTGYTGAVGELLDRYLNGLVPLHIFDSIKKYSTSEGKEISWTQWLRQYASQDEVMQILFEHAAVLHAHATNERIKENINALQSSFVDGIDWLQSTDRIGSEPKNPTEVSIHYGDIFDTYLKEQAAYYFSPESKIVLGQGHRTSRNTFVNEAIREQPIVLTHELVHGLLGKALYDTTSPLSERWIDEAMTELISRVMRERAGEDHITDEFYLEERALLAELIKPFERDPFILKMLSRAYTGTSGDRESVVELFDGVYGAKDVLEKVTAAISWQEKNIAGGKPINRAVEQAAVISVTETFRKDPEAILLRGVDILIDDMKIAAQEPK